jgi:hypothetical protein
MTRDEAMEIVRRRLIHPKQSQEAFYIDLLADLGLLKLEEPKSIDGRIEYFLGTYTGPRFLQFLNANGLKIVEKQ